MADKSIDELPVAQELYDNSKLVVSQLNEAHSIEGRLIRKFAQEAASAYVEGATKAAGEAHKSAEEAAENAAKAAESVAKAASNAQKSAENANRAEKAKQSIEDMTVSAETLPAGSEATATKLPYNNSFKILFGIPRGIQGEVGPQGEQGIQGKPGEKGERGDSGVLVPISTGFFALSGDEEGNLWVYYNELDTPPQFEVDDDGNIYYIIK